MNIFVEVDPEGARKRLADLYAENEIYQTEGWQVLKRDLETAKANYSDAINNNITDTLSGKEVAWKGEVRRINWMLNRPEFVRDEIKSISQSLEELEAPSVEQPIGLP